MLLLFLSRRIHFIAVPQFEMRQEDNSMASKNFSSKLICILISAIFRQRNATRHKFMLSVFSSMQMNINASSGSKSGWVRS